MTTRGQTYQKNNCVRTILVLAIGLEFSGICSLLIITQPAPVVVVAAPATPTWNVTLELTEGGGRSDTLRFGEAPDAHNGPPPDNYDVPKPPAPIVPYLRAWFNDELPAPYDALWEDFRSYPGQRTTWNLSVQWVPLDYTSSTTVTIVWDPTAFEDSEYPMVGLYDEFGEALRDMRGTSSYSFLCSANIPHQFSIRCQNSSHAPEQPMPPLGETTGYHETSYAYRTMSNDSDGDSLYYQFDWGDSTTSGWIGPYPSDVPCEASYRWGAPGEYHLSVQARDSTGMQSRWSQMVSVVMLNRVPLSPSSPDPPHQAMTVPRLPTLRWMSSDPDGDLLTFDVFFGWNTTPSRVVSHQSRSYFSPGVLTNQTAYYWRIVAWDPYNGETIGPLWSFTTGVSGEPNGSAGSENRPPRADASLSDHIGIVGSPVLFDGSQSSDPDGYLVDWFWDFGDGAAGSGEKTTHSYHYPGVYEVTLMVTDLNSATGNDTITVQISTANHPPGTPEIRGTSVGVKNTLYTFWMTSIDPDNDFLQYTIRWGDDTQNTSGFLPNATPCSLVHEWKNSGKYTITGTASDNITQSPPIVYIVLIDAHFVGTLGYLFDTNNDDTYDEFYLNDTGASSVLERLSNGSYLLDGNGTGHWRYLYDPGTGALTIFYNPSTVGLPASVFFTIILCAIVVIAVIVYFYKKGYF